MDLRFHLAGINNQNFLMRDEQTGTYWQQITGMAVAGPLAGRRLQPVSTDELTFALWKQEQPAGTVLEDMQRYSPEYAKKNWDVKMAKAPTVISYAQAGIGARDLMLGVESGGASRAFPFSAVLREKLIEDRVGGQPVMLVVGSDERSVRAFSLQLGAGTGEIPQFFRLMKDQGAGLFMDAQTGSQWNFEGCAVAGTRKGACLKPVSVIKDYWFDWRNYHSQTSVYGVKQTIR